MVLPVSTPILGYTLSDSSWYQVLFKNYSVPSKQDDLSRRFDATDWITRETHSQDSQAICKNPATPEFYFAGD